MADWNKIKAEYIAGGISYRNLAKKHNVSFPTLRDIAIREKWVLLREQAHNDFVTSVIDDVSAKNVKYAEKIYRVADKATDKIEELISQEGLNLSNLKQLTSALKDIKDIQGIKSDIDLKEQITRIKKLEKEIEGDNADKSITIRFEKEGEDYAV